MIPPTTPNDSAETLRLCAIQVEAAREILELAREGRFAWDVAGYEAIRLLSQNGLAAKLAAVKER